MCWCETDCFGNDLDDVFGYNTLRVVRIRDRRLGIAMLIIQFVVACYIVGYQLVAQQYYRLAGSVVGDGFVVPAAPSGLYRAGRGLSVSGANAYCAGAVASGAPGLTGVSYATNAAAGTFSVVGSSSFAQQNCTYADPVTLYGGGSSGRDRMGVFLPTFLTSTPQSLGPQPACASFSSAACAWSPTASNSSAFVADVEFLTLAISHSFVSNIGLAASSVQLEGTLYDQSGATMSACAAYASAGVDCPSFISAGVAGTPDVLALQTLLVAAGVTSLDLPSDSDPSRTYRQTGFTLILRVHYSNYALSTRTAFGTGRISENVVQYFYTAEVVPLKAYSVTSASYQGGNDYATSRVLSERNGIHVVLSVDGRVGLFNPASAILSLTAALGLLAVAVLVNDMIMMFVCPFRKIYRHYKVAESIDLSDIKEMGGAEKVLAALQDDHRKVQSSVGHIIAGSKKLATRNQHIAGHRQASLRKMAEAQLAAENEEAERRVNAATAAAESPHDETADESGGSSSSLSISSPTQQPVTSEPSTVFSISNPARAALSSVESASFRNEALPPPPPLPSTAGGEGSARAIFGASQPRRSSATEETALAVAPAKPKPQVTAVDEDEF